MSNEEFGANKCVEVREQTSESRPQRKLPTIKENHPEIHKLLTKFRQQQDLQKREHATGTRQISVDKILLWCPNCQVPHVCRKKILHLKHFCKGCHRVFKTLRPLQGIPEKTQRTGLE